MTRINLFASLFACSTPEVAPPPALFQARMDQDVGGDAESVCAADLDADGHLDLVVATDAGGGALVLWGEGDGRLRPGPRLVPGERIRTAQAARINADPWPDLVLVSMTDGTVRVMLGDGEGGFEESHQRAPFTERWTDGLAPLGVSGLEQLYDLEALATGDIDGDGDTDLVIGRSIRCRAPTTFKDDPPLPAGAALATPEPRAMRARRGDYDDLPDCHRSPRQVGRSVAIMLGDGDGGFAPPTLLNTAPAPVALVLADLLGGPALDLAMVHRLDDLLVVYEGDGRGGFHLARSLTTGHEPSSVAAGDLDGDDTPDLVVSDRSDDQVSVFLSSHELARSTLAVGRIPDHVTLADLDGDGRLDLITANGGSPATLTVHRGDGAGGLELEASLPAGHCVNDVIAADLDEDGTPAVIAANSGGWDISVHRDLTSRATSFPLGASAFAMASADLDGDGAPELAALDPSSLTLLDDDLSVAHREPLPAGASDVLAADWRGRPTLIVASDTALTFFSGFPRPATHTVALPPGGPHALASDAARLWITDASGQRVGTLTPSQTAPTWLPLGRSPTAIATARVDGDSVAALATQGHVLLLRGDPPQPSAELSAGSRLTDVLLADLDGDGILDLAAPDADGDTLWLWWGRGGLRFDDPVALDTARSPVRVAASDLDGDGHLDLVTANYNANDVTVLYGRPGRRFARQDLGAGFEPSSLLLVDLDRDGDTDIATGNASFLMRWDDGPLLPGRGTQALSVLWNRGSGR